MIRACFVLAALLVPTFAAADDTFESTATGAVRVRHLDDVVWALTATCDKGDEVQQRQCRRVRDESAKAFIGATLLIEADAGAFEVGHYDAKRKSVPITLSACLRCGDAALSIDGKPWFVTAQAARVEGGKVRTGKLSDTARQFPDETSATAYAKALQGARVELVAKLAEKRRWQVGGKDGVLLDVLAYRVVVPCDGSVVLASPPSAAVPAERKACGTAPTVIKPR